MLSSAIVTDENEKFDILKSVLDVVTMYINPELYREAHKKEEFVRKNVDFAKQSSVGRQTGRMHITPQVMEAIKKSHEARRQIQEKESWRPKSGGKEPPVVG